MAGDDPECSLPGRHKPSPYMYLRGCEALGVDPTKCIAFEDSLAGIKSAQVRRSSTQHGRVAADQSKQTWPFFASSVRSLLNLARKAMASLAIDRRHIFYHAPRYRPLQAAGIPVVAMRTAITDGIVPDPDDASESQRLAATSPVRPVVALVDDFDRVPRSLLA